MSIVAEEELEVRRKPKGRPVSARARRIRWQVRAVFSARVGFYSDGQKPLSSLKNQRTPRQLLLQAHADTRITETWEPCESTKLSAASCPPRRSHSPSFTACASLPPTMSLPNLASGTSSASFAKSRKPLASSSASMSCVSLSPFFALVLFPLALRRVCAGS